MRTVLRRPDFRLFFAGMAASITGDSIMLLALAIWVKSLTGSSGLAGATIFAVVAPTIAAPLFGLLVDRFRRRPFLIVANLLSGLAMLPLLLVRDAGDVWIIYLVAVLYGVSFIVISAATSAMIKDLIPDDLLAEANGAFQTVRQGLRLIGPLAGATLYAAVGGWVIAVINAATFVVAALAIAAMKLRSPRPRRTESHWFTEAMAGLRYLLGSPPLMRVALGAAGAVLVLGMSESAIFAYNDEGLHRAPTFVGALVTVQGIGGLIGGLMAARIVKRIGEIASVAFGVAVFGLGTLAFVYAWLPLGLLGITISGFGLPPLIVGYMTLLQRVTPTELVGRVSAAGDMLVSTPQAVSIAAGAVLVTVVDYRYLFGAMALVMSLVAIYLWRGRNIEVISAPRADADAPPDGADGMPGGAVRDDDAAAREQPAPAIG